MAAVCAKNYDAAGRLGIAYSDDLRLVSDDLGWGDRQSIELKTPARRAAACPRPDT